MSIVAERKRLLADRELRGSEFTLQLSDATDQWLQDLFSSVVDERQDLALIAVGGYGRRDLSPLSDLDVLLLHDDAQDIESIAESLWYPIWDQGENLGHSVRTITETLDLANEDLDTATSLLSSRIIAGSQSLADELVGLALQQWKSKTKLWLPKLAASIHSRHRAKGEVAFMLEPELKEGRGGLRDVHAMGWANLNGQGPFEVEHHQLLECYEVILRARVELHKQTNRSRDKLLLEQQDAVSEALGYEDADLLMTDVSAAARRISWNIDELCYVIENAGLSGVWNFGRKVGDTITGKRRPVSSTWASDSEITAEKVLRIALRTAKNKERFSPDLITRLREAELAMPDPWTDEIRQLFIDLLLVGHDAIPVFETLDQLDLFVPFLPEWKPARSRPQRNA